MNDVTSNTPESEELVQDELATLKARATQLGITFHPAIGLEKLKMKVNLKLNPDAVPVATEAPIATEAPVSVVAKPGKAPEISAEAKAKLKESIPERNRRLKLEAHRLIRIRVACMNPAKKEYEGEMFTVSNSVVGTLKKYVPFNTDDGWHVPYMIYQMLKERQCQVFYTAKGPRGNKIRKGKMIKEFAIEIMEPLTKGELKDLAQQQAMANNLD